MFQNPSKSTWNTLYSYIKLIYKERNDLLMEGHRFSTSATGRSLSLFPIIATRLIARDPCSDPRFSPYDLAVSSRAYEHRFAALASSHLTVSRIASPRARTALILSPSRLVSCLASRFRSVSLFASSRFSSRLELVYSPPSLSKPFHCKVSELSVQ